MQVHFYAPPWHAAGVSLVGRMATVPRLSGADVPRAPPSSMYRYLTGAEMGCAPCSAVARVAPALSHPRLDSHPPPPASSVSHLFAVFQSLVFVFLPKKRKKAAAAVNRSPSWRALQKGLSRAQRLQGPKRSECHRPSLSLLFVCPNTPPAFGCGRASSQSPDANQPPHARIRPRGANRPGKSRRGA